MWPIRFVNPAMLYLAAAAVVPIILHLLRRRRPQTVRFPTVRFLRRTARRSLVEMNLKYLLLLLLRMVLMALFAVILARPLMGGGAAQQMGQSSFAACAIIIDDSMSMSYRRGDSSWFEQARSNAIEIVGQLPDQTITAILTTSNPSAQFTTNRDELRARLTALRPTLEGNSCWRALERAAQALRGKTVGARTIFLLTDMTRSAWAGIEQRRGDKPYAHPLGLGEDIVLRIVDVGDLDAANLGVTELRDEGGPFVQGASRTVQAGLLCVGRETEEAVLVELDGRVVGRHAVRLAAGATERLSFQVPVEASGHHWGRVSFQNTDALPFDDSRVFTFEAAEAITVLCVQAGPKEGVSTGPGFGEPTGGYFFRSALNPWGAPEKGLFRIQTATVEQLENDPLTGFDLVARIDVPALSGTAWTRLADFVSGGGGLLVTCGAPVAPEKYAGPEARRLLPAALGQVVDAGERDALRMRIVGAQHPLVSSLAEAGVDLGRAAFRRCRSLEIRETGVEVLSFGPELPALVMAQAGGRVAIFSSSMDTEWSDFPTQPEFVPFCQELALYLAGRTGGRLSSFLIGQQAPINFEPSPWPTDVVVTPPDSREGMHLAPGTTPGKRFFHKTRVPGYYRVAFARKDRQWGSGFAVNTADMESDLRRIEGNDLLAAIRASKVQVSKGTSGLFSARPAGALSGSVELTPYAVLLGLAICISEIFLANRLYRAVESAPGKPAAGST